MKKIIFPKPSQRVLGIKSYFETLDIETFLEHKDKIKYRGHGYSVFIEDIYGMNGEFLEVESLRASLATIDILNMLRSQDSLDSEITTEFLVGSLQKYPYDEENPKLDFLIHNFLFEKGKLPFDEINRKLISHTCFMYFPKLFNYPILYNFNSSGRREGDKTLFDRFKESWEGLKPGLRPAWEN